MKQENLIVAKKMYDLSNNIWVKTCVFLGLLSYFYNLPVLKYAATGENELRLYDVVGILALIQYYYHFEFYWYIIKKNAVFYRFHRFFLWCLLCLIVTLFVCIYLEKVSYFFQCILYLYHMYIFFLFSLFLYVCMINKNLLTFIIYLIIIFSSITCLIVILQNFGIIPYLWSEKNKAMYLGFLSGTLGPNKIVLGITTFITSVFLIGLYLERKISINKISIIIALVFNIIGLLISGSRTAYLAGVVFLVFFIFKDSTRFLYLSLVLLVLGIILVQFDFGIYEVINNTIEGRIVSKIEDPKDVEKLNVNKLYDDLGSGRNNLSILYYRFFIENPIVLIFGSGFNNKLFIGFSAHNIYLSLINELGIVGLIFYLRWITFYLTVKLKEFKSLEIALKGITISMIVTLFFGEHLYIYRALFGLLGYFLFINTILLAPSIIDFTRNININDVVSKTKNKIQ